MPRTNSRKRNNQRNDITSRLPVASNLSPNAPEFIPTTNDENQREHLALEPIIFNESTNASNSNGNNSHSNNSEATNSSTSTTLASQGQRDLLINLLNDSKVDCVICYERAKNVEPIWSCRSCFQIMHLKCIMVWFIKSQTNSTWRCPACQSNVVGKPNYVCFCGALPNPFSNNVDTPHSCGQVCGLKKKNTNSEFDDCHHKCTLLCHPGPCPQCVVQVLRKCGCGKTKVYVHCGQSTPILCQNICSKILNCKNHVCEKQCHADKCEPCKKPNTQCLKIVEPVSRSPRHPSSHYFPVREYVTAEELRMLGLDPNELFQSRSNQEVFYLNNFQEIMSDEEEEDIVYDYEEEEENDDYDLMYSGEEMDYDYAPIDYALNREWLEGDNAVGENDEDIVSPNFPFHIVNQTLNDNRPVRIFGENSVSEDSTSSGSSNNSYTNTINSSNLNSDENEDEPLDLSGYDPNRFYSDEGGSFEEENSEEESDNISRNYPDVIHEVSESSDEVSYSEDSTSNSQSSSCFIDDSNSNSTDTTTDTSSSN